MNRRLPAGALTCLNFRAAPERLALAIAAAANSESLGIGTAWVAALVRPLAGSAPDLDLHCMMQYTNLHLTVQVEILHAGSQGIN